VSTELTDAVERVWREQGGKLWRPLVAFSMSSDGNVTRITASA
jgi:hypothetical protein